MNPYFQIIAALTVLCFAPTAAAQVQMYRHHSTALGDYLAARAELTLAHGMSDYYHALALKARCQAERQAVYWAHERAEARQRRNERRLRRLRDRLEANQQRHERLRAAMAAETLRLVAGVRSGQYVWPAALERPEFAGAIKCVELILARLPATSERESAPDYRALATIARQLRHEIAQNRNGISHLDRVRALRTIGILDHLAESNGESATPITNTVGFEVPSALSYR